MYDNATHINGVPDTYLPVREGCRLTLYNDAHQVLPRGMLQPSILVPAAWLACIRSNYRRSKALLSTGLTVLMNTMNASALCMGGSPVAFQHQRLLRV